ncbi:uncharacterized protein LOC126590589 isoform X2 [Malus sylvestris]|uniref:uncharacterized protein LOC126590589 isoform X2 n=1 Tax=Malus sylvestris TaxID=3752 RepID=UPI0021ABCA87|nr:uncharacterized protein LOC126590589 isoform X2 [Malus sylvestris]
MLGELHRSNPTVVPPYSTADMYSPFPLNGVSVSSDGNANGADFNSPYYLHEAVTTLQCYLPLRQAMEAAAASCVKTMPFLSSPPEESPPVSPMSRSLGLGSINEMVASFRNLQLGKFKSFPSSRNVRMGGSSGFGSPGSPGFWSPCGSMRRPGFSSLPSTPTRVPFHSGISYLREEALVIEMQMQMQMKSYLKDSNAPTDSNVGVGGVVTPNGTANHELAAQVLPSQPLLKLWTAALIIKAAHQFMEAKGRWEMNEINTTEEAIPTRYYCYKCRQVVTVHVEMKCPFCQGGFIQACEGVASLYLAMPSESELSESASDREVTSSQWILLLTGCGIEILASAFDQVSSPRSPHYALISMLLAIVAVLLFMCELLQNAIKEGVELRRRGMLPCFHYPHPKNMLFGTFPQIFGLGQAIVQCIWSAVQYHFHRRHVPNPLQMSPSPVVFAFSLVVSKLVKSLSPS